MPAHDEGGEPARSEATGSDGEPRAHGGLDRRGFLKRTGALVAGAGSLTGALSACGAGLRIGPSPDVAVIGAGAFGSWTAYWLRELGANVTLVDQYGPGNERATSGGETRGVRTSYGHRNDRWVAWASRAIERWQAFDEQWSDRLGLQLFYPTGDLIMREDWDRITSESRAVWDELDIAYEVLDHDELAYRYPQIDVEGIDVGLYERDAGVVRARRAIETVAGVFRMNGGEIVIARAVPGGRTGDRLDELVLTPGEPLRAETYVFALGPWFPKMFPELMGDLLRIPIGHVYYYGTPAGDNRFTHPNMPSYNFPGVTGWPSLPPDNRGFRVRTGGRQPQDPDASVRWVGSEHFDAPLRVLERFPALVDAPLLGTRSCHYELSATRDWLIDRHPDYSNVWIAGGGSAEGFKFGPVLGEYIARRVLGDDPHPEIAEELALRTDLVTAA